MKESQGRNLGAGMEVAEHTLLDLPWLTQPAFLNNLAPSANRDTTYRRLGPPMSDKKFYTDLPICQSDRGNSSNEFSLSCMTSLCQVDERTNKHRSLPWKYETKIKTKCSKVLIPPLNSLHSLRHVLSFWRWFGYRTLNPVIWHVFYI